jgi:hypothetical protein
MGILPEFRSCSDCKRRSQGGEHSRHIERYVDIHIDIVGMRDGVKAGPGVSSVCAPIPGVPGDKEQNNNESWGMT